MSVHDPVADQNRLQNLELARLVARVVEDDQDAFAELYRITSKLVYGLALRVLRHREHAEEVSQEVYIQVWQQASRFDPGKGSVWAWLTILTHRRAVDRVRSAAADSGRDHQHAIHHQPPERDEVWDQVSTRHDAAVVRDAVAQLTPKQREAVSLAYFDEHTVAEIAADLGSTGGTVRTRLRDGIGSLRKTMPFRRYD